MWILRRSSAHLLVLSPFVGRTKTLAPTKPEVHLRGGRPPVQPLRLPPRRAAAARAPCAPSRSAPSRPQTQPSLCLQSSVIGLSQEAAGRGKRGVCGGVTPFGRGKKKNRRGRRASENSGCKRLSQRRAAGGGFGAQAPGAVRLNDPRVSSPSRGPGCSRVPRPPPSFSALFQPPPS